MRYGDDRLAKKIVRETAHTDLPTEMERAESAGDHNTCFHCGCRVKEGEDCCAECRPVKERTSAEQLIAEGYSPEAIDLWREAGLMD